MESLQNDRHKIRKTIRQQMQFYFSDSNLNRDNFMRQSISSSHEGFIELTEFLKFNKIRKLTQDVQLIVKALKKSKELELNETQTAVKRVVPMKEIENVDERTVYVEFLPMDATHEWITKIFSTCGKVSYISLPRYQTSGQIKQFAFVEYRGPEQAQLACQKLNNPPSDAPDKPGKFPAWNKALYSLTQRVQASTVEDNAEDSTDASLKRRLPDVGDTETTAKKKMRESESSGESDSGEECDDSPQLSDADVPQLRVIPKLEWSRLKDEYIKLQKTNMAKLKKTLNKTQETKMKKVKQNGGTVEKETMKCEENQTKAAGPEFVPGVIVKIESSSPVTKQQIRDEFGAKCNIAYVELVDGTATGYVRCKDSTSANMIVDSQKSGHVYTLLSGEEEEKYWEKLTNDRTMKFSKKVNRKKMAKPQTKNTKIVFD